MSALRSYAARLGGDISGVQILCPGPGHSAADRSLAVRFDSKSPDDFAVFSFAGDDWRECRDHVRERLGKRDFQPEIRSRNNSRDMGDRVGLARRLWRMRRPIEGTPAERYLREARGYAEPLPATLRYLPGRGKHPPAMIAAYGMPSEPEPSMLAIAARDVRAVHLTRLAPADGPRKITIASPIGSPIVLAPANDLLGLAICEGIEDALSVHQATGLGAWAGGAAGFLPALADAVPEWIDCVTVCADADKAGRKGAAALAAALRERGFDVETRELGGV